MVDRDLPMLDPHLLVMPSAEPSKARDVASSEDAGCSDETLVGDDTIVDGQA